MRRCKCGCGAPLEGRRREARYASPACRTRDWKRRRDSGRGDAPETSRNGKARPVELRISLRKAEKLADGVVGELDGPVAPAEVRRLVGLVLEGSLSDLQRQRVEDERGCVSS
jgi:hypothetical protein